MALYLLTVINRKKRASDRSTQTASYYNCFVDPHAVSLSMTKRKQWCTIIQEGGLNLIIPEWNDVENMNTIVATLWLYMYVDVD